MNASTAPWYFAWVGFYREKTGARAEAVTALIANEDIAVENWQATEEELREVTNRLVRTCRTPNFPNEHTDAIGTELIELRKERERAGFMVAAPTGPGDCPMQCERGMLIAPLPHLVKAGATGRILARQTCAVLCDVCQCGKAEIVAQDRVERLAAPVAQEAWKKKKLMTLTKYYERTNGVDGIGLLRQHEAEVALHIRENREGLIGLPTIKAMLAASMKPPARERSRGPEAIPA